MYSSGYWKYQKLNRHRGELIIGGQNPWGYYDNYSGREGCRYPLQVPDTDTRQMPTTTLHTT